MQREIHFMGRLPEFYRDIYEFKAIGGSEDAEFQTLAACNAEDLRDAFIMTGAESSIAIWEKEIGIRADPSAETLDFRRKRLINRYTTKPPFTIQWLDNQLSALLGGGFIRTERDGDVEILYVYADLGSLPLLREFDAMIEFVLPLSMQYFKRLSAHRDWPAALYAGSTNPTHIHLFVNPA